ncbi:hypothetical protein [Pseudosulfitobacter koreensis]|uniref:NADH-quinone oxidoreductase subunit E n=1 Tax=Pseudosulfitobacter koreensis TaxID=2968472 RepID=A0ABT1Z050_9RHOB|nr:hypothetical protein [Pseudosulfitobacter koreense]MCR8826461.1 hypothetical protein [Pseudosulfitobacter koreense]
MMNNDKAMQDCARKSWMLAAITGAVLAVLLIAFGGWGFFAALVLGILVFGVFGFLLKNVRCTTLVAKSQGAQEQSPQPATQKPEPAAKSAPVADVAAPAPAAAEPETAPKPAKADAAMTVKPSARLEGQEELAARKGDWKYEKPSAAADADPLQTIPPEAEPAAPVDDPVAATDPEKPQPDAPQAPAKRAAVAADGKPELLSAPREGGPDDLKKIKGVGPKLEALLHEMGVFHFSQVASWRKKEVEWADQNLAGFKGRVSRDEWVKQAKVLAKGDST